MATTALAKKPNGRPAHVPTDETRRQVEKLAAYGITHDSIAGIVGISDETLRKHYATELALGKDRVIEKVAGSLIEKATSDRRDAVSAAKFFLSAKAGWAEKTETDHRAQVMHVHRVELVALEK